MKMRFKARGVSLPPDMHEEAEKRLAGMRPWVSSFSAYVQRLIALDLERGLLDKDGGVNSTVVGKGKRPFNSPLAPFNSNALTVPV